MSEITIKQVTKRYGAKQVLKGVDLNLAAEHIYALLGRNGVGKSTLLRMINNRTLATSGSITMDGQSVVDNETIQNRVYLMNDSPLYPIDKTVSWHFHTAKLMFGGFDEALAAHLVKTFHVDQTRQLRQLSTGFKTIVKLIIALCVPCDFILLDEPVLGLDAPNREQFYQELLATYAQRPRTFVIATHLIEEIATLVDHVFVLAHGVVTIDEAAETLQARGRAVSGPRQAVASYLAETPILSQTTMGQLTTAYTMNVPVVPAPAAVQVTALNLQQLFIALTREDESDAV